MVEAENNIGHVRILWRQGLAVFSSCACTILSFNNVQLYSLLMDIRYPKHVGGRRNDNGMLYVLTSVF
jgi:hypothetical protein